MSLHEIRYALHLFSRRFGTRWILEVVDEKGTSIVWRDQFDSDALALEEFERVLEQEGMAAIVEGDS